MPDSQARTLVEAHLFINVTLAGGAASEEVARDHERWTTVTEGEEAWTLRFEGPPGTGSGEPIEVQVPYASEAEAREEGSQFGVGLSELLDPGQWQLVSAGYARRVLDEDLRFAEDPTDRELYESVVLGWEFARDAAAEVLKFMPPGVDEVPSAAFWTEMGREAYQREPDRFTRSRLTDDISFYQESLDTFTALYAEN
ncbi:hypothetical protein OG417_46755 [Actinoallomurus sp. NBC_01490]|uniref:hypothetical protein n=1 Tax=Actinoallomurus sp. NBC_01490 TaxID=2903557 RepID=UPI002E3089B2|nr:hypothetical protein [Actinoallomurus sp. NBC_01490]